MSDNTTKWIVRKMKTGIYTITSPSGKQYVGSAVDFAARRSAHFHLLRKEKHYNNGLQRACAKYGIDNLIFRPLLVCTPKDLIFFEQRAIDFLKPKYNACPTAGSQLGRKHRPESIAKFVASKTGRPFYRSPEGAASFAAKMTGHPFWGLRSLPAETRRKVSLSLKGGRHADGFERNATEQQKEAIVDAYLSGMGQLALAAEWKTSHKVIRRILTAAGVQVSPSGHSIKPAAIAAHQNGS